MLYIYTVFNNITYNSEVRFLPPFSANMALSPVAKANCQQNRIFVITAHLFTEYVHNSEYVCVSFQIPRGLSELFTALKKISFPLACPQIFGLLFALTVIYYLSQQQLRYCCEYF